MCEGGRGSKARSHPWSRAPLLALVPASRVATSRRTRSRASRPDSVCRRRYVQATIMASDRTTVRITQDHIGSPQFQGQHIRAVGKLMHVDDRSAQLLLAGSQDGGE